MKSFKQYFNESTPDKRYKELKKMSKENLVSLFKQKNNVVNTKGVPKEDMISDILNQEYSRKEIEKAFGQNETDAGDIAQTTPNLMTKKKHPKDCSCDKCKGKGSEKSAILKRG